MAQSEFDEIKALQDEFARRTVSLISTAISRALLNSARLNEEGTVAAFQKANKALEGIDCKTHPEEHSDAARYVGEFYNSLLSNKDRAFQSQVLAKIGTP